MAPDAAYLLPRSLFRDDQDWKRARRLARSSLRTALPAKSRHNLRVFVGGALLVAVVWCVLALLDLFSTP